MAKKAADASKTPKRGRPKSSVRKPPIPVVVTIRAGSDWEAWIDTAREALVRQSGLSLKIDRTDVIDAALGTLAEKLGLPAPPARY